MTIGSAQVNARDPKKFEAGFAEEEKRKAKAAELLAAKRKEESKVDLEELDGGLTLLQYQLAAHNTAVYPEVGTGSILALSYLALKMNGEVGEVAEKLGKIIRDKGSKGSPEDRKLLLKELGDALWYLAMFADELDASLEDVANMNIAKLKDRQERGVLGGSGDER